MFLLRPGSRVHFVLTDDGVYELVPATIEHHRAVGKASDIVEFPDALIAELATAAGCRHTVTLDRRAGRLPAMRVLGNSG